ncbi:MAG: monovalent cation/H+ antiporter subunit D family protein [Actinobacteria bacterium]|nr:monovalent cation/H+ antiporter subunit D family protein [Actinomycetota bacterium]
MEAVQSSIPLYALVVSLAAVVLIGVSGKKPNLREFWTIAAAVLKFGIVASMLPVILEGKVIECFLINVLPGLDIKFKVDALGIFFALTASFLWIITSFYSIGYVRSLNEHAQTRYFMFFAVALSATMGVAFSANLFTTFVFYEIITFCTFPLVAHKGTPEALKGARRYLVYLLGTSVAFQLFAIFLTYNAAGTLEFANDGILAGQGSDVLLIAIFILFMAGIAKAGMMPFHSWLPAAMVAPTPVSALLHAVAVVKTGVFVVLKVVLNIFGVNLLAQLGLGTVLAFIASFTIIVASIIALRQDNLKARLAYSTVSQLSYVMLGASLLTLSGITGSVMHIGLHAFGKITLFFTAGAIYVATHKTKVSELDGIGKQMPFTMAAFTVGSLSMIGLPPLGGFLSKWYIGIGAIEAGQLPIIAVIAASTMLNAAYFLPIVYAAFFKELPPGEKTERREAPAIMVVPLTVTAIGTLVLFLWPSLFLELARMVVAGVM